MSDYDCEAQYGKDFAKLMLKRYYMWLKPRRKDFDKYRGHNQ